MIPKANFLFPEGLQKEKSLHHFTFQFAYPALFACILKASNRRKKKKKRGSNNNQKPWCTYTGVIMGVVFVLLFPFGATLIRLLNNRIPNAFALHRGVQILGFILACVGFGMGIWRSGLSDSVGLPPPLSSCRVRRRYQ